MKIIIEGSPKELAKLAAVLNGMPTAEKKAEIPPLLTELASEKFGGDNKVNELAEAIRNAGKENAPQAETAEQDITFASIKPRFEACIKRVNEANAGEENAQQADTAEQEFVPFLVRDDPNRGHRKRIKRTSYGSENQTNDSD